MRIAPGLVLALALGGPAAAEPAPLDLVGRHGAMVIAPAEVVDIAAVILGGTVDVTLRLAPEAGARLAAFTAGEVGTEISIRSCGAELLRPRILEAIAGGGLTLAGLRTDQAQALRAVLLGQAPCSDKAP